MKREERAAVWSDQWDAEARAIRQELRVILQDPAPAWLQDRFPGVTEPPRAGETAIDGLAGTEVGGKLYTLEAFRSAFPDGPLDPRHPVWHAPLQPLARALASRWRVPGALRGSLYDLAEQRGQRYRETKVEVVAGALLSALAEQSEPVRVRIFREWHSDVRPATDLPPRTFLRWLVTRTLKHKAEARLAEPGTMTHRPEQMDAPVPPSLPDDRVAEVYAAARDDKDRRLLDAIAETDSIAEAARAIGVDPATARQRLSRLRKRLA